MKGYLTLGILIASIITSTIWYIASTEKTLAERSPENKTVEKLSQEHTGDYVLIHLDKMTLELRKNSISILTVPLISIGKKGSYYETIGGAYTNDYKEPLHFSSIGHVYMPYSVHIFGNYFIHGIPYFPDGTKVSSDFTGGCIRLSDENAKRVYDFVKKGTPIIITSDGEFDFSPTALNFTDMESMEMTRLLVATISLEVLTQDTAILNLDGVSLTTRRKILPRLIKDKNDKVSMLYAHSLGETTFVDYMNKKTQSLGLTNTIFTSVTSPVRTTEKDYARFMEYIDAYKSYLRTDMRQ